MVKEISRGSNKEVNYILEGYRGSIAHGLAIREGKFAIDDEDLFEIFVMPLDYYLNLDGYLQTHDVLEIQSGSKDIIQYELRKFVYLLSKCNPNVLSFLWNKPEFYTKVSEGGKLLIENRKIFLSRNLLYKAFTGYAYGQFHKMTHQAYEGYMGEKRKKLVNEFGYDTKNAAHLLRLLKQCIEVMQTGELKVYRDEDRDFLIEVKTGRYTLEEIQRFANDLFEKAEEEYQKCKIVPPHNNRLEINSLLAEIIKLETKEGAF
jgi:predicted nucleotidyltransferase